MNTIYDTLGEIEKFLEEHTFLFGSFSIVKKVDIDIMIKKIYDSMPNDLIKNIKYIRQFDNNIFSILSEIENLVNKSVQFAAFIIVHKDQFNGLFDKLYVALPDNIEKCRNLSNN